MGKPTNQERIIEAALACFDRFGIAKTTMDDVAEAAQLGRMTVYRAFPSRLALLQAVSLQKMEGFTDELLKLVRPGQTFEEMFLAVAIKSVELAHGDAMFQSLLENSGQIGGSHFFLSMDSPVATLMQRLWSSSLAKARENGQLNPDIGDKELMTWFRDIEYVLLLRDDLDREGQEAFLRKFILPALRGTASGGAARTKSRSRKA